MHVSFVDLELLRRWVPFLDPGWVWGSYFDRFAVLKQLAPFTTVGKFTKYSLPADNLTCLSCFTIS